MKRDHALRILGFLALAIAILTGTGCDHKALQQSAQSDKPAHITAISSSEQPVTGKPECLVRLEIPVDTPTPTDQMAAYKAEAAKWKDLEDALAKKVAEGKAGDHDGNEFGGGKFTIWFYGRNATKLARVIRQAAAQYHLPTDTTIFIRHGEVHNKNAKEEIMPLK